MTVDIEPRAIYEGRVYAWTVIVDHGYAFTMTAGGTGPCWNIGEVDCFQPDEADSFHSCNLDALIAGLTAFAASLDRKHADSRWD